MGSFIFEPIPLGLTNDELDRISSHVPGLFMAVGR